jgi:hypothetical protein
MAPVGVEAAAGAAAETAATAGGEAATEAGSEAAMGAAEEAAEEAADTAAENAAKEAADTAAKNATREMMKEKILHITNLVQRSAMGLQAGTQVAKGGADMGMAFDRKDVDLAKVRLDTSESALKLAFKEDKHDQDHVTQAMQRFAQNVQAHESIVAMLAAQKRKALMR